MAQYNEILTGRHNRFIQKLFSMKGRPPAPQLSGDIQMSHHFFHGAENRYIESWSRYGVGLFLPATVGQVDVTLLRNPAKSNVIAVVEKLFLSASIAQELDISRGSNPNLTTVTVGQPIDGRQQSNSTLVPSTSVASPTVQNLFARIQVGANLPYDMIVTDDQEMNLLPSEGLQVNETVANSSLIVTYIWRERALEESELS